MADFYFNCEVVNHVMADPRLLGCQGGGGGGQRLLLLLPRPQSLARAGIIKNRGRGNDGKERKSIIACSRTRSCVVGVERGGRREV